MDSRLQEIVDAKAEFRKPSGDASSRKYRRRSPCERSSPASDDRPSRDRSSSPVLKREYEKVYDDQRRKDSNRELDRDAGRNRYGQSGGSYKHSDCQYSRSSRSHHHRDYYDRRDKYANDSERENSKLSYRSGRESRGNTYSDHQKQDGVERYSRDKLDDLGYRGRDKDRDNSYAVPSRRHGISNSEDVKYGDGDRDGDRNKEDRESRDYKKNCRSESGDHRNNHSPTRGEFREYPYDSSSRRDSSGRRLYESSRGHSEKHAKEEKRKYDDQDRYKKFEEGKSPKSNDLDSPSKKPKALNMDASTADEKQSSTSKQTLESTGELTSEKAYVTDADIDAAKIAAMKAAELVNRNLVGTGFMSTEQKKKLLWGNKKTTTNEEPSHSWDTSLFGDRERQEKFKKLMSLRLPWCIWPIVGCEGGHQSGAEARNERGREREDSVGLGEAIHCWTSTKRRSHSWTGSLSSYKKYCCISESTVGTKLYFNSSYVFPLALHSLGEYVISSYQTVMIMMRKALVMRLVDGGLRTKHSEADNVWSLLILQAGTLGL